MFIFISACFSAVVVFLWLLRQCLPKRRTIKRSVEYGPPPPPPSPFNFDQRRRVPPFSNGPWTPYAPSSPSSSTSTSRTPNMAVRYSSPSPPTIKIKSSSNDYPFHPPGGGAEMISYLISSFLNLSLQIKKSIKEERRSPSPVNQEYPATENYFDHHFSPPPSRPGSPVLGGQMPFGPNEREDVSPVS